MIKKKHRKLFFKKDFKKIIGKKTRFENVDDIFNDAEQNNKRNKGINIDDVEHALSRKRMYSVSKHYTGNDRMHVSRAKAFKMHKIAYGKKSKRKDAEYLYQELKLTNKSTKAVVISNFLSSKNLETIYNIRLKRGRGYSLPPHVKTTMNAVVGAEKHKGIKLRLWNPLRKERTTIDARKVSTVPGTNTDLKLNVGDKIARKTKQKGRPITLIEEREIWKNAMDLISKEKIEKRASLSWTSINDEILDPISRCMIQKNTPLEQGIRARPGHGWKTVRYEGQKVVVYKGKDQPDFGYKSGVYGAHKSLHHYKTTLSKLGILPRGAAFSHTWYDNGDKTIMDLTFQGYLNSKHVAPTIESKAAWRFYATDLWGMSRLDKINPRINKDYKHNPFYVKGVDEVRMLRDSLTHLPGSGYKLDNDFQIIPIKRDKQRPPWSELSVQNLVEYDDIWDTSDDFNHVEEIVKRYLEEQKLTKKQKRELFFANKKKYAKKK